MHLKVHSVSFHSFKVKCRMQWIFGLNLQNSCWLTWSYSWFFTCRFFHKKQLFLFNYSKVIKLKLLCEPLKNEKWKILAWYPNKMQQHRQLNPQCNDWYWTSFQMQVALDKSSVLAEGICFLDKCSPLNFNFSDFSLLVWSYPNSSYEFWNQESVFV